MFRKLRPGWPCGPAKDKTGSGSKEASGRDRAPPPRLELPRHRTAGTPKPPHLKSVDRAGIPHRAEIPSDPRASARAVARPVAQPIEQAARPAIPPYPVSCAAAASAARAAGPQASPARTAEVQSFGRLMLVGPQIRLKGEIKACERLVVEGIVEGEVSDTKRLEVARGGCFQGIAQIESCSIDGDFEGDLDVRGVLTLKANGRVAGKVRYGEIEIERGGIIAGDFNARGAAEVSGQATAAQAGRPRSAKPAGPRPA
jgi:cytoskeletal protein CcmA (bactofilin family)